MSANGKREYDARTEPASPSAPPLPHAGNGSTPHRTQNGDAHHHHKTKHHGDDNGGEGEDPVVTHYVGNGYANGHTNGYTNGSARNVGYTNGVGSVSKKRSGDLNGHANAAATVAAAHVGNGDDKSHRRTHENDENGSMKSMFMLMSPGVNKIAKRRQYDSPSTSKHETREINGGRGGEYPTPPSAAAARAHEADAAADMDVDNDAKPSHTPSASNGVHSYDSFAPQPSSLPWSRLHNLLEAAAESCAENVAYSRTRVMSTGTDVEEGEEEVTQLRQDEEQRSDRRQSQGAAGRDVDVDAIMADSDDEDEDAEEYGDGREALDVDFLVDDDEANQEDEEIDVESVAQRSEVRRQDGGAETHEVSSSGNSSRGRRDMDDDAAGPFPTATGVRGHEEQVFRTRHHQMRHEEDPGPNRVVQRVDVSYGMVLERITKIANALRILGVKPADRVGIMLPNCPEYFELYFAISCASAISVQLNPRLAAPELRGILHDSQCQYIFAPSELELMQLLIDVDTTTNTVVKGVIWVDTETDGWAPVATMAAHTNIADDDAADSAEDAMTTVGVVESQSTGSSLSNAFGRGWLNCNANLGNLRQFAYEDMATLTADYWLRVVKSDVDRPDASSPAVDAPATAAATSDPEEERDNEEEKEKEEKADADGNEAEVEEAKVEDDADVEEEDGSGAIISSDSEASVATLFYTSGTTGVPKGVMLTHANVLYHALRTRETLGWKAPSEHASALVMRQTAPLVWGHFAPMFHVGDAWAVFAVTEVGGRHVFCPRFEVNTILSLIEEEAVEYTKIVPTMLHLISHSPQLKKVNTSSLKMVVSGGAPLHVDVVAKAMRNMDCDLLQDYGMTECCCHITLGDPAEEARLPMEEKLRRKVKAGKVFKGMQVRVVDPEWEADVNGADEEPPSAAIDEVGELWVRGDNLFAGYWRRPDETERVMYRGWFRTGDLGSIDRHGYVNVSDRKKDMIISGGENVFSIEVETVLRNHPRVSAAAVYGVPHALLGELVHAAVTLNATPTPSDQDDDLVQELKTLCQESLAPYKVPRQIEIVADFPRGPTGKIQKHILRNRARAHK